MKTWDQIYDKVYDKERAAFVKDPDWVEVAQEAKEEDIATILKHIRAGEYDFADMKLNEVVSYVADEHADMLAISEADTREGRM